MSDRSRTQQSCDITHLQARLAELERRIQQQEAADRALQEGLRQLASALGHEPATAPPVNAPLTEEQVQLNRLTQLGEMAASLAHQLSQPLAAIATYTRACLRTVRSGNLDVATLTHALERVANQADHAGEFVRHLRQFLVHGEQHRATADINDLVHDVLFLCESEMKAAEVTLELKLAAHLPTVLVDRAQIEQVLLNLVRNALDALKQMPPPRRRLTVKTAVRRSQLEVSVSDTGPGLPGDMLCNPFQPFRTTKPHGLGLGLTISRSLIEAHQGELWAKPNAERGTTFTFVLPSGLSLQHDENATHSLSGR
jgi:C4-dicarboxylate-specific signal transduction histidine kinase